MVYLTVRLNKDIKDGFFVFCENKGITLSSAVRLYVSEFVRRRGHITDSITPSSIARVSKEDATIGVRIERSLRDSFVDLCNNHNLPASYVVRDFMFGCVKNGAFPYGVLENGGIS